MTLHKLLWLALVAWLGIGHAKAQTSSEFEVAGLHLGMTLSQARQSLVEKGYNVETQSLTIDWLDKATLPLRLVARRANAEAHSSEYVQVWLSHPPSEAVVLGVYRGITHDRDTGPLATAYFDLAREKAGFEIYRHLANVYAARPWVDEQLIRWRPDGKRVTSFGKLLSNLPSSEPTLDPCVANYRPTHSGGILVGARPSVPLETVSFASSADAGPNATGFFIPRLSCGATFESLIVQDGIGLAQEVGLLLIDQSGMVKNAAEYRRWKSTRDQADSETRRSQASKAEL
ncbi:hypothetical protein MOK15_09960 [Sphingobium sp. BYY-5]|uniref:hypothetical protein n=1 Tax=Sphingobium sp. BYY-5 TaxID=2926400 RepID=UPI001FA7F0F2|nr:hypothetical protein [Sphingobium sp. BYY-5]MCI4590418.1 hypothetical protein [Sphingobium sp. BYY-5]